MTTKAASIFQDKFPNLAGKFSLYPFQEQVVSHVLAHGSTVAVTPTGSGKSLIYWVTAQALGGTCLVISPLIALIDEQADKLTAEGFKVMAIHGGMGASEQIKQLKEFATGRSKFDFIFASPERMATDGFFEYCINLRRDDITLLVIDEIHCVSQWGFDFRPFYKRIPEFLDIVFPNKWPVILGLTATINPRELKDVSSDFKIPIKSVIKDDVQLRFDIELKVEKYSNEEEKEERLWQLLDEYKDVKILVYLYRKYHKRGVEELAGFAIEKGYKSVSFHGDMTGGDRQSVLADFKDGKVNIIFATNAFGMGIDIPDIRVVIHFMLPESIEQYYQEVGRGGRDKNSATAYLLYTNKNIQVRKIHFIDKSFPGKDEIESLYTKLTNNESGKKTLQYFAEEDLQSALPYFLKSGAVSIIGKGFTGLKIFKKIDNSGVQDLVDSSKTGMVIPVMQRKQYASMPINKFFGIVYNALIHDSVSLSKSFDKCLIINVNISALNQKQLEDIENETNEKREYKHGLLDILVYNLDNYSNSVALHQEIGHYLGVNKHLLGKIYFTESQIWVRSLAEVIIANILYRSNIPFKYEKKIFYTPDKWKEPDFTIEYNGKTWYWEHLGRLGEEEYDKDWVEKKQVFQRLGIMNNLIITYPSNVLSNVVNEKIKLIMES